MKIAFIGGVKFSHEILSTILDDGWDVTIIFSYADSKINQFSDYANFDSLSKKFCIRNVKVNNINDEENIEILNKIKPDLILVMGWSQLLKNEIISIPNFGVIGSHPTELPKYRGRAPIPWTILKELKQSALTFFFIEEGIDNGDILDQKLFLVNENDDATSVYRRVTEIGKEMIISNLYKIKNGMIDRKKQEHSQFIENWPKRTPDDGKINWELNSKDILKLIRASTYPYPGAFTFFESKKVIIWKAELSNGKNLGNGFISEISNTGITVGTKDGTLLLKSVQIENNISNQNLSQLTIGKNFSDSNF